MSVVIHHADGTDTTLGERKATTARTVDELLRHARRIVFDAALDGRDIPREFYVTSEEKNLLLDLCRYRSGANDASLFCGMRLRVLQEIDFSNLRRRERLGALPEPDLEVLGDYSAKDMCAERERCYMLGLIDGGKP